MRTIKMMLVASCVLAMQPATSLNNDLNTHFLHAHDVKITVSVNRGQQPLGTTKVKVIINNEAVAEGETDELVKLSLLVKNYNHEKAMIVVKEGMVFRNQRNLILQARGIYSFDLDKEVAPESKTGSIYFSDSTSEQIKQKMVDEKAKEMLEKKKQEEATQLRVAKEKAEKEAKEEVARKLKQAEKEAKEKEKAASAVEKEVKAKAKTEAKKAKEQEKQAKAKAKKAKHAEKEAKAADKKAKKEAKASEKLRKAEAKYEKKLVAINKSQKKINKSREKLVKAQSKLYSKK